MMAARRIATLTAAALVMLGGAVPQVARGASGAGDGLAWATGYATSVSPSALRIVTAQGARLRLAMGSGLTCALVAPGLGLTGPKLPCPALSQGAALLAEYRPVAAGTGRAVRMWIDGAVIPGMYDTSGGGPDQAQPAPSMVLHPTGSDLADGDTAVIYQLRAMQIPDTAYLAYLSGWPAVTGVIRETPFGQLEVGTLGGWFEAGTFNGIPSVTLHGAAVPDAFLVPGATATVSYAVTKNAPAPEVTGVSLVAVRETGLVTSVATLAPGTEVATLQGDGTNGTVTVLPQTKFTATGLGGTLAPGDVVSVTGVGTAQSLYAVDVADEAVDLQSESAVDGTISAAAADSVTLKTAAGFKTFAVNGQTLTSVGLASAPATTLAPGEAARVVYAAGTGAGAVPVALAVSAEAQTLSGIVTAVKGAYLTLATPAGGGVRATIAPTAAVHGAASTVTANLPVSLTGLATPSGFAAYDVAVPTSVPTAPLGWVRATLLQTNHARALLRLADGVEIVTDVFGDNYTAIAGSFQDSTMNMREDPGNYVKPGVTGLFQLVTDGEDAPQPGDVILTPVTIRGTLMAERSPTQPSDGSGFVVKVARHKGLPPGIKAGERLDVFYYDETTVDGQPMGSVTAPVGTRVTCTGVLATEGLEAISIVQ